MGCGASRPNPIGGLSRPQYGASAPLPPPATLDSYEMDALKTGLSRAAVQEDLPLHSGNVKRRTSSLDTDSASSLVQFAEASSVVDDLLDGAAHSAATQAQLMRYFLEKRLDAEEEEEDGRTRKRAMSLSEDLQAGIQQLLADRDRILSSVPKGVAVPRVSLLGRASRGRFNTWDGDGSSAKGGTSSTPSFTSETKSFGAEASPARRVPAADAVVGSFPVVNATALCG